MNLLLVAPDEIDSGGRVRLTGRRAGHLRRVLRVEPGRRLRAGVVGQGIGTARVTAVDPGWVELIVEAIDPDADQVAAAPQVGLILAMPRPKALRRILRLVAAMGVRNLTLTNAWRVEKSYFASPVLEPQAIRRELLLGAEQGGTARLPEVAIERLFVRFLERLEAEPPAGERWVAHPSGGPIADTATDRSDQPGQLNQMGGQPGQSNQPGKPSQTGHESGETLLAIGPEGGWIEDELGSFDRAGFRRISLGPWVLTTEAAVAVALGQLHLANSCQSG